MRDHVDTVKMNHPAYELPKGLLKWYPFRKGSKTLFITGGADACASLAEALTETGLETVSVSMDEVTSGNHRDKGYVYIVGAGILERSRQPETLLGNLRRMLAPGGRLLLGTDNRLGIRYFCGDRDPFTGHNFDGIENYTGVSTLEREKTGGRAYARAEITHMLETAGFRQYRFYSVFPVPDRPQALYAEDYLPEEELDVRITPQYHSPDTVFLQEEGLYTTLIQNGLFHAMANGYLVECPMDGSFANMKQVTISMDRGRADSLATIIRRDGKVEKKPLYREGQSKTAQILEYKADLQAHGIHVIDGQSEGGSYVMPYVQGEPVTDYFRRLLCEDRTLFLQELDRFRALIIGSSEHVPYEDVDWENFDPAWQNGEGEDIPRDTWRRAAFDSKSGRDEIGVILERGYPDLVSHNCFFVNGDFVFYDQEFCCRHLPANAILMRTIDFIYWGMPGDSWKTGEKNRYLETLMPRHLLQERYCLNRYQALWHAFSDYFIYRLVNGKALAPYHQLCRRNSGIVRLNRYRMNYSEKDFAHFQDIFRGAEYRDLYLFGSGSYTKHFIKQFGGRFHITGLLDNDCEKWGTEITGIRVFPPAHLQSLPGGSYKVIICIRECIPVMKQLEKMGIQDYSVYDRNLEEYQYAAQG